MSRSVFGVNCRTYVLKASKVRTAQFRAGDYKRKPKNNLRSNLDTAAMSAPRRICISSDARRMFERRAMIDITITWLVSSAKSSSLRARAGQ